MPKQRMGRNGRLIEIGGDEDIPKQIEELLGDIHHLADRLLVLGHAVGLPDLNDLSGFPEVFDEIPDLRKELNELGSRVDVLAEEVSDDVRELSRRVAAFEAKHGG